VDGRPCVVVGSHPAWRKPIPLRVFLQNSHQDGGPVFLIFVANPRTGISAVRTSEDILPNAHVVQLDSPPPPTALIAYRLAGTISPSTGAMRLDSLPSPALASSTRVRFRSTSTTTSDTSTRQRSLRCSRMWLREYRASNIASPRKSKACRPRLTRCCRSSIVARRYPLVETLGSTTDLAELEAVAALPENAEADRERLEGEVAALRSNTLDALCCAAKDDVGSHLRCHIASC
jgi:hypothetical protein